MFSELPVLQGRTGYNVELNSAKTYAADAVSTVLLFNLKGARRTGAVHYNGRAMGGNYPDLRLHAEFFEHGDGGVHHLEIRFAAH